MLIRDKDSFCSGIIEKPLRYLFYSRTVFFGFNESGCLRRQTPGRNDNSAALRISLYLLIRFKRETFDTRQNQNRVIDPEFVDDISVDEVEVETSINDLWNDVRSEQLL